MKKIMAICLLLTTFIANANNIIKNAQVTQVTIYRSYAKETRIGHTSVPKGNSEVIISNISASMDENSIQVGVKNNVKILSVSSRLNYIPDPNATSPTKIQTWQDSVKLLDKKTRLIAKRKEAYEAELNILNTNNKLGSNAEGLKANQLKELLELNRIKQTELKTLLFEADEEYNELKTTLTNLQNQLAQSNSHASDKPAREIVLKVFSTNEINTSFKISYLVTNAGWTPCYDIRCENVTKPLFLNCKAKITQATGFDWKNVNIKLSTANPNANHNRPILYPIYVDFMQPDYYQKQLRMQATSYNAKQPATAGPGNVQMMSNMAYMNNNDEFKEGLKVDEKSVTIAEGDMMVEYDIEQSQDIESDGQEHIIAIQEISLPAQYNYHTVPKLDNGAILLALVTDWGKYNLLAGESSIFFDDMYIGKSYLNPNVTADTLLISLGRDEKINIKRSKLLELCETKKFSNKKKETLAYEVILKNNKNIPIEIELLDQFPISKNNEIEVTLEDAGGAEVTKDYGKLLWHIKLQPGENKKVRFVYTLKFPEDKKVAETN